MQTIDTFGWDVVYATTYSQLLRRLTTSGKLPTSFSGQKQGEATSASGSWGGWELRTEKSIPSNFLWLRGTVDEGLASLGNKEIQLAGSTWTVQFSLKVQGDGSFVPANVPPESPHLAEFEVDLKGKERYQLQELFAEILSSQILCLGAVFGRILLGDTSMIPYQPWLVPTFAAIAMQSYGNDGIVGVLAMTEGRSDEGTQPAVDERLLRHAPEGADAALAIGQRLVNEQLLMPAIAGMIQGSSPSDFALDNAGVVISNNKEMTWGAFTYEEKDSKTSTIQPTIPKGNIELSMTGGQIHLSMSDIHFKYPGWSGPGYITIAFDTEQFVTFKFVVRGDGDIVMLPHSGNYNSFNVTVTPSESLQIFQIALNVTLQILFAILGGVVESILGPAEQAATDAIEEGGEGEFATEMGAGELDKLASDATPQEIEDAEEASATEAAGAVENEGDEGYVQQFKSALNGNKYKIVLKFFEKMVEIPAGQITSIAVAAAKGDYDKLPSLSLFAASGIKPVTWQGGTSFKVTSGALEEALIFRGTLED